jgi:excisionase family DNA binding protein
MKSRDDATPRRIMTAAEVAEYLQVHKGTIYRIARIGKIPAFKIGDDWRFDRDAIEKWTTGRTSEGLKKKSAAARAARKKTGMH